jgi:hypothetical protein
MTDTMGMMGETSLRMARLAGAGFCCAQIFVLLALEDLGRANPDQVRAAQGAARREAAATAEKNRVNGKKAI